MAYYRLYLLDAKGHIRRPVEITADSDDEAVTIARDQLDGQAGQLWNLDRKVMDFRARSRGPSGSPDQGASHA